jgi:large subunit ribosomal protein L29
MKIKELSNLAIQDLKGKFVEFKKELFNLRFQKTQGQLKNTARMRFVKKTIAKILTLINLKGV